jgi:hypothetical protein
VVVQGDRALKLTGATQNTDRFVELASPGFHRSDGSVSPTVTRVRSTRPGWNRLTYLAAWATAVQGTRYEHTTRVRVLVMCSDVANQSGTGRDGLAWKSAREAGGA